MLQFLLPRATVRAKSGASHVSRRSEGLTPFALNRASFTISGAAVRARRACDTRYSPNRRKFMRICRKKSAPALLRRALAIEILDYALAQNISPGFSCTTDALRVATAFAKPSLPESSPSSCSIESTSSYPIMRRLDMKSFHHSSP